MKLDKIAEQQIRQAQLRGELDNLAGAGKPLCAQETGCGPEAVGFKIMAGAGAVPEEVKLRKEVEAQRAVLQQLVDPQERKAALAKLADIEMRLAIQEEARRNLNRNLS
ncbi:DUF1992 domain-containing protein [Denitrobaculum tricleocarpae]|uniref:DUF1992 domain-containing protein n=1 Tax=Denitrobaculum tricleocarpae TaxID=2591009 RepID=A0A545TEW0_9PROT|nr:DUF1992 domain-containing protein [Denitrobaculum tricleocarpae]TQV75753.1 DUF1992 domain-containing protein [Denitrobaculum tricleocarpae]